MKDTKSKRKKVKNHSYHLKVYPYLEEHSLYRTFLVHDTNTIEALLCSVGEAFNLPLTSCFLSRDEKSFTAKANDVFDIDFPKEFPRIKSMHLKLNDILKIEYDELPFYLQVVSKMPLLEDTSIKIIDSKGEWNKEVYSKVRAVYQDDYMESLYWMYGRDD